MLLCLTSAKGAPGVTTAALSLASVAAEQGPALLVEADPSGGDLICWGTTTGEAGLLGLASTPGADATPEAMWPHTTTLHTGTAALTAPTAAAPTTAALAALGSGFAEQLHQLPATVFVDLGRISSHTRSTELLAEADLVLVVCRPTLDGVEHARSLLNHLPGPDHSRAVLVIGGHRPYRPDEVADALAAPVIGMLPWDPRGVRAACGHAGPRIWTRSPLANAARAALAASGLPNQVSSHD